MRLSIFTYVRAYYVSDILCPTLLPYLIVNPLRIIGDGRIDGPEEDAKVVMRVNLKGN